MDTAGQLVKQIVGVQSHDIGNVVGGGSTGHGGRPRGGREARRAAAAWRDRQVHGLPHQRRGSRASRDGVPQAVLNPGAAIGLHRIGHDEVYYVLSSTGDVTSDGATQHLKPGMAAYLYQGASVGIKQEGEEPLAIIVSYPNAALPNARPANGQ